MSKWQPNDIQRIGHFEGELLAARDLQDDVDYERRLRGLHVRGLHNTWGVALGYTVSQIGNNLIQVGPGIAYDCRGREVVSSHTFTVGLPVLPVGSDALAWWFDLVISYNDLASLLNGRQPTGTCLGSDSTTNEERPAWRWVLAAAANSEEDQPPLDVASGVRLGEEIPLVRVRVTNKQTITRLDFGVRRHAQGLVRPHIAGGQVTSGVTFDEEVQAYPVVVNTAAGGFNQTPLYFARLTIPSFVESDNPQTIPQLRRILGPFVSIRAPSRTGFILDLRLAFASDGEIFSRFGNVAAATAPRNNNVVIVNWVGIESNTGCAPTLQSRLRLLFLSGNLSTFDTHLRGSTDEQWHRFSTFGTTGLF